MAAPATAPPGTRQPPPGNLNLSSNNPFRNRMSTATPSPRSADPTQLDFPFPKPQSEKTMSKNPFLDPADSGAGATGEVNGAKRPNVPHDIFKDLSLLDKPAANGSAPPNRGPPPKPGSLQPPRPMGPGDRRGPPPPGGPLRGPGSPPKRAPEHHRRASEGSITEKERQERRDRRDRDGGDRAPRTESEERRRRERRKEREERYKREGRDKNGRRTKPQRNLDLIDKLDVTGIYGQGLFHHDGPFDACNPHRNARKDRRAPMQAFPEGSANMAMGGSGPLNSRLDLDRFHGRGEEGFQDYGQTRKADTTAYINPTDRTEQVHGEASYGLGTSTFLEGAPASKRALERRESEEQTTQFNDQMGGGLQRKKSLAQRIRGMSASQRRGPGGDIRSPDARYHGIASDGTETSPSRIGHAVSAGGPSRAYANYTNENEVNPFDNEYDAAFERKGTQIRIAEQEKPAANIGRARAPSSPKPYGLTRSVTADAAGSRGEDDGKSLGGGGGFLNRMKSLKGGRRTRPERKESSA